MKTIQEVIAKMPDKVIQRYDYSDAQYTGALKPITGIVCPDHGVFQQYAARLRKGFGCPQCGSIQRIMNRRMNTKEVFANLRDIHGNKYEYNEAVYEGMNSYINAVCAVHGAFRIRARHHYYRKQGCPQCGAEKRCRRISNVNVGALAAVSSIAKHAKGFHTRVQKIHGDKYDYSKVEYKGMKQEITIICPVHGDFTQCPEKHIYEAQGCPRCGQKSKGEDAVADYLATFTRVIRRDRTIIAPKELDIVLPDVKIAIEYCGSYHHSVKSMDAEKAHKLKHYQKHILAQAAGYRLITIFDYEWETRQKTIKRLLRNAIGKAKGRLMARKCEMRKVSVSEAREFYDKYHPQGGAGSGEHYGLYWKDKLVACMRFVHGANDRGANHQREWTLGRYATRVNVAGAASKLFKAFLAEYNPPVVKSFSDNRLFSGRMYEQLGFTLAVESSPDYQVWSPKLGVRPKSHYQRRLLQKRIEDHGSNDTFNHKTDTRTEAQITYSLGCGRLYDCGKKKWVYNNP